MRSGAGEGEVGKGKQKGGDVGEEGTGGGVAWEGGGWG